MTRRDNVDLFVEDFTAIPDLAAGALARSLRFCALGPRRLKNRSVRNPSGSGA